MKHSDWLKLMQFPPEWTAWDLIPPELVALQLSGYEPGHEDASEHDRHGAFQWWLMRHPVAEVLVQLARLSWVDPDQLMAHDVRNCIARQSGDDIEVGEALAIPYRRA